MNLEDFLEIREGNIEDVHFHFSEKIENLKKLYQICLKYSVPFFKDEEGDDEIYFRRSELKNEVIVFENNISIISLFDGIFTLLENGNHLGASFLERSIFEFLIVNNHLILTQDNQYIEKWLKRKDVKIVKNILKRTNNGKSNELIDFWVILSKQSHASFETSQTGLTLDDTYGKFVTNLFTTYLLLYFYNYQLRYLYFPYMQKAYDKMNIKTRSPYKSDWFKKQDNIREFEKSNNEEKLFRLLEAFTFKWELKTKQQPTTVNRQ